MTDRQDPGPAWKDWRDMLAGSFAMLALIFLVLALLTAATRRDVDSTLHTGDTEVTP